MNEPRDKTSDEPEVKPDVDADVLRDLDAAEDADDVRGGNMPCQETIGNKRA